MPSLSSQEQSLASHWARLSDCVCKTRTRDPRITVKPTCTLDHRMPTGLICLNTASRQAAVEADPQRGRLLASLLPTALPLVLANHATAGHQDALQLVPSQRNI